MNKNTLTIEKNVLLPNDSRHNDTTDMVYVKKTNKIYAIFNSFRRSNITEIDATTLRYKDLNVLPNETLGNLPALATDGTYLYVLSNTNPTVLYRIDVSRQNHVSSVILQGASWGHAITFYQNTLYATGAKPAWVTKIDPRTLTYIYHPFLRNDWTSTDDLTANQYGIFIGLESHDGTLLQVDNKKLQIRNMLRTGIMSPCYGVFSADGYVWALYKGSPGKIVRINPKTTQTKIFTLQTNDNSPNEFTDDGTDSYLSFWDTPYHIEKLSLPRD